jgi:signal transduction histidine kinase
MRDRVRAHWPEIAWAAFAAANLAWVVASSRWETIPFHFVWVSLTLVYGIRVWRMRSTFIVLGAVMALTAAALLWTVMRGHERLDEVAEVPLMAAMFLAMVWHARRRQAALDKAERHARGEHVMLERQRDFVRDASHELRTPITVARGHLDLVRSLVGEPQALDDLDVVRDELERLAVLSERLLLLAAADHPEFLSIREVDVGALLAETVRRWHPAADRAWSLEVGQDAVVEADPDRLAVAIDAVIENALDATEPGDRIRVGSRAKDESIVIEVADTGVGIAPGALERVFERFARADADRARASGGTGLGLAIVRSIAEAHGGTVRIDSEPGVGTSVSIRLPAVERAPIAVPVDQDRTVVG